MKKLQAILVVILAFLTTVVGVVSASAATYPTKLSNVKKGAVLSYNGYDSLYYKTSGSYQVFCTKFHVKDVGTSCSLANSQWSEPVQAGIAAIIKKYNGSKSQKNYYYSELAINEFLYYYGGKDIKNKIGQSGTRDVRNTAGVKGFYDTAVSAYNNAKKSFDFKISNTSLTFKESGNYYVSNKITVKDGNGNLSSYTASVSGAKDAKIYNKSGNSFYVRVPKSSVGIGKTVTIKVNVKGTRNIDVAKKFDCGGNVQTLTPNTTTKAMHTKDDSISGKITLKGNKVVIYKRIEGTKTNLAGAKLKLVSTDGKFSKTWTSTTKAQTFENLTAGTYYLTETSAPAGYTKSDKKETIKVAYDGKTQTVIMYNAKKKLTSVKVIKIDVETNKALEGATLVVKDSTGKEIDKWTSTTKEHVVANVKAGQTYTLSEEKAPEGYIKTDEVQTFKVNNDDKAIELKVKNTPKNKTIVKVIKLDADTKEAISGATLVVTDENGKEIDKWTSTKEEHVVKSLEVGKTYSLKETQAPEGYTKSDKVETFKVKKDSETITYEVLNKKIVTKVEILKIDSETKKPLSGATLVIKDSKGNVRHTFVSKEEAENITGLEKGKYTLTETIAPTGYELTEEVKTFEVKYDGKTVKVELENKPITVVTKARISKQDATTSQELPGAHLVIKDAEGNIVKEWDSSTKPYEFELDPGKYTLTETIAPAGYKLSTETVEFEVKDDGTVSEVVMYNSPEDVPDIPDEPDEPKYPVRISKQDITTKQELPGATLIIKDSEGKEIARWVSTNTPKEFMLFAGDYTLTEIQAPSGYDLSYEVVEFTVEENNAITTEAVMYNSKTPQTADRNVVFLVITLVAAGFGSVFGFKKFRKQI